MESEKSSNFLFSAGIISSIIAGVEFGYYHALAFVPERIEGQEWILFAAPAATAFCLFMDYLGKDVQARSNSKIEKILAKTLGCYAIVQLGTGVVYGVGSAVGTLVEKLTQ